MGPFDFCAAGTDNGVPNTCRRWPLKSLLLFLVGMALVVLLVALFIPHV